MFQSSRSLLMNFVLLLLWSVLTTEAAQRTSLLLGHQEAQTSSLQVRRRIEEGATIKYEKCFQHNDGRHLVYFLVCPASSGCVSACYGGAEYVSDLEFFLSAFALAQQRAACVTAQQACGVNYDGCFESYGCFEPPENVTVAEYEAISNSTAINVLDYIGCEPYGNFSIGPYCQDYVIYLGAFMDDQCTWLAGDGVFASVYGRELEYSYEAGSSLVEETCATCSTTHQTEDEAEEKDQSFYYNGGRVQCRELYAAAAKAMEDAEKDNASHQWVDVMLMVGLTALAMLLLMTFCWLRCLHPTDEKMTSLLSDPADREDESTNKESSDKGLNYEQPPVANAYPPPIHDDNEVQKPMITLAEAIDETSTVSRSITSASQPNEIVEKGKARPGLISSVDVPQTVGETHGQLMEATESTEEMDEEVEDEEANAMAELVERAGAVLACSPNEY